MERLPPPRLSLAHDSAVSGVHGVSGLLVPICLERLIKPPGFIELATRAW
jgi:hypothetical protein